MPSFDFLVETEISRSARARQLEAMFDVPPTEKCQIKFAGELPIDERAWNVGLIVGPSGSGKSTILEKVFGKPSPLKWKGKAVVDDFAQSLSMQEIAEVCQAVGFNTIPAWLRPFAVLSNGEKFRVEMARRLLESSGVIVMDEFTSVVDRQVAQIGAHAVQKHIRRNEKQFVAASCHYDVIDWLQPDWIFEPATMSFHWRLLRRRPELSATISRVNFSAWRLFAPYHYLTADLNKAARCFALFVNGRIASFAGTIHRPHPKVDDVQGVSRLVTLPDWQGLGLAMVLVDYLGAAYKAVGKRLHTYPAHPALIRAFDKSPKWKIVKRPGHFSSKDGETSSRGNLSKSRPCAVFQYTGEVMSKADAERLINV